MPSFTHFFAPAAPRVAPPAATHSRCEQAVRCRVLCTLALIVVACLAVRVSPALAAFPGHNGKIAFTSDRDGGDFDIWTMSPKGRKLVNLTANSPADDQVESWSADGQKLAFMSNRMSAANPEGEFEIFVMNADGSNQTQITSNALDDEDPAWSPDGRQIVFVRDFNPIQGELDWDVFTMNADGTGEHNLTNSPVVLDFEPNWSPDGRKIVFTSDRDGDNEIYTMSPSGSKVQQLTVNADDDEWPNWSPDGRRIAFNSNRSGNFEIHAMRADGEQQTQLTFTAAGGNALPAWSPNGRELAFASDRDGGSPDVFTMRADGSKPRNRTNYPLALDFFPDWQPRVNDHHGDNHGGDEDDD